MHRPETLARLRFSLDDPGQFGFLAQTDAPTRSSVRARFLNRHVQISESLFPELHRTIVRATHQILGEKTVNAFISADESMNAFCVADSDGPPLIWLSSGLVKALSSDQLCFVIGHELGHWFFGHSAHPVVEPDGGPRFIARQQLSRASEISCDRMGLVACGDLENALLAILKTASGLDEKHIGSRVADFVDQARKIPDGSIDPGEIYASHPPMAVRARALLWFSMSNTYLSLSGDPHGALDIVTVNSRVERDLTSLLGEHFTERRAQEIEDAILWMTLYELIKDGSLSKEDQILVKTEFGAPVLEKVLLIFQGKSALQVKQLVKARAVSANQLLAAYPHRLVEQAIQSKYSLAAYAQQFRHQL